MLWVLAVFAAGGIIAFPVGIIERSLLSAFDITNIDTAGKAATASWMVAGFLEEGAKLAVVLALVIYRSDFDEPMDGIVYAAAASLGFAAVENALYVSRFGAKVILFRGPFTTLGHLLFSSIWGYAIGRAKFDRENRFSLLTRGFILSAFFHGLYDFFVFTRVFAAIALYVVSGVLWQMMVRMVAKAQRESPYISGQ